MNASKSLKQIANGDFQSLCHAQKRMDANPLFAAFNFSDIHGVEISFFSQLFLTQIGLLAIFSDGISEGFKLLTRTPHSLLGEQEGAKQRTPNMGLFSACALQPISVKKCESPGKKNS
jgi:hypothetical protein